MNQNRLLTLVCVGVVVLMASVLLLALAERETSQALTELPARRAEATLVLPGETPIPGIDRLLEPPLFPSTPTPVPRAPSPRLPIPLLLHTIRRLAYPAATDFPISDLPFTSEESPAIDGTKVVWFDDRTHGPTDVWGYDLATGEEFQVTTHPVAQFIADIGGDIVVYEDNRNGTWDIYASDLSTGEEFVVATGPNHQRYPRIWGDYIVYQDETADYFQSDVYLYQISTSTTTPLAVALNYQGRPSIDSGWVVWVDNRTGEWQLGIYELSTGIQRWHRVFCDDMCKPDVSGDTVVWNDWRSGNYDIYMYDIPTDSEMLVFDGPGDQRFPVHSDTLIVWQDEDTYGNWDVFVYVRADGTLFPVTLEPSRQEKPAVFGNTVVWQDNRSHTWGIYGLIWDGSVPPGSARPLQNPRDLHVGAYPGGEIQLSWTDNITNELGFVIQRADGIFGTDWYDLVTLPANTTNYVDQPPKIGESYWYRVRAYNADGDSSYSNESYSTTFSSVPNLDERHMHLLMNEARMDPGYWGHPGETPVPPMGWHPNLAYSARAHAVGMDNSRCCQGHIDLAGRGPTERAFDSGYPYGTGENLFVARSGRAGMESAHQGFMNSAGHRANIMASGLKQVAIGFSPRGSGSWSLVEVFSGGPAGTTVPVLPSGIVVPYTDTVDATFDYLVTFWDQAGEASTSAKVYVDGIAHGMTLRSGQPGRGTYVYSTTLALGTHAYHFEFAWGSGSKTARLPESGEFSGPYVRPFMVELSPWGIWVNPSPPAAEHDNRLSAWVYNRGELPAVDVAVHFYDGDPGAGGVQIDATQVITRIEAGEGKRVEVTWHPVTTGMHEVYVVVDPDDVIEELDETNNVYSQSFKVRVKRVELSPSGIWVNPSPPPAECDNRLSAWVHNQGELPALHVAVDFYDGDPGAGGVQIGTTQVITRIGAGEGKRMEVTWHPVTMGIHEVYVAVDPDDVIEELDETNNVYSQSFEVRVKQVELSPSGIWVNPSPPAAEHDNRLSTWVYNRGELPAVDVAVHFYDGDPGAGGVQIDATQIITRIEPGESKQVEVIWRPVTAGTHEVYAVVDPDDVIEELDETNNVASRGFEVREAHITWYADGSVSESGDGRTPETAFKTISEALTRAYSGDTVQVSAGTYRERFTVRDDIELIGAGAEQTIIHGSGTDGSVIYMEPGSTIDGFTITGSGSEYFDSGIWHSEGQVTIRHNRFAGNSMGLFSWCWNPDCGAVAIIENSIFAGNSRAGVDANNEPVHHIVNNTVVGNGRGLVLNNAASIAENNIIVQNSSDGLVGNDRNPTVRYNDVWSNGRDYLGVSPGPGDISANPRFVNPSTGNYHVRSGSPAIDAGNPAKAYRDPDGSRNDMGAYGGPHGIWQPSTPTPTCTPTPTATPTFTPTPTATPTPTPEYPWVSLEPTLPVIVVGAHGTRVSVRYGNIAAPGTFSATLTGPVLFSTGGTVITRPVSAADGYEELVLLPEPGAPYGTPFSLHISLPGVETDQTGVVGWPTHLPMVTK